MFIKEAEAAQDLTYTPHTANYHGTYYYLTDHQGGYNKIIYRILEKTMLNGQSINVVKHYDIEATATIYKPYGKVHQSSYKGVRYYTGQEWDAEAELYYYNARYYDPDIGLFLQPDPVMQNPSPYLYVGGNPVNRTDPTGMCYGEDCSYVKVPNTRGGQTVGFPPTSGTGSSGGTSGGGSTTGDNDPIYDPGYEHPPVVVHGGVQWPNVIIGGISDTEIISAMTGQVMSGAIGSGGGVAGNRPGPLSSIPNVVTTVTTIADIVNTMSMNINSVTNFRANAPAIFVNLIADSTAFGSTYIPGNIGTYVNLSASTIGTIAAYIGGSPYSIGFSVFGLSYTVGTMANDKFIDPYIWRRR